MIANCKEIEQWDKKYRLRFINSISGYKGVHLIGSANRDGQDNVAIFNSVVHVGASPALIGFVMRPDSVERNTYQNIKETGVFTINHVHQGFVDKAHYTSVKFPRDVSEFDECGLTPQRLNNFKAPYVGESMVKIGLKLMEKHTVKANDTIFIVGEVQEVHVDDSCIGLDGQLDLQIVNDVCVTGLNQYSKVQKNMFFPYARKEDIPNFKMKQKPDNVAFDANLGRYNAHILPYGTNIGAPKIQPSQVSIWKNTSIISYNHALDSKVQKLKDKYETLINEYNLNDRLYKAKMNFDPLIGKEYHMYKNNNGEDFLSLIEPGQWDREYLGTYALSHEKVWEQINN